MERAFFVLPGQSLQTSQASSSGSSSFKVIDAMQETFQLLNDYLHTIHWLKENDVRITKDKQHLYSALGGVILLGDTSVGKSSVILESLHNEGYTQLRFDESYHEIEKGYYLITPDMHPKDVCQQLLHAFKHGYGFVVEEFNAFSHPKLERLMNAVLNRVDLKGRPPLRSGFFVMASMNPETKLEGRRPLSLAVLKRFIVHVVPDLKLEDQQEIIRYRFASASEEHVNSIIRVTKKRQLTLRETVRLAQHAESEDFDPLKLPCLPAAHSTATSSDSFLSTSSSSFFNPSRVSRIVPKPIPEPNSKCLLQ